MLLLTAVFTLSFGQTTREYETVFKKNGLPQYFSNGTITHKTTSGTTHQTVTVSGKNDVVTAVSNVDSVLLRTATVGMAIDLGLTSGTLWSSMNLGATDANSSGEYYSWGETEPKSTYSLSNYLYYHNALNSYDWIGDADGNITGTEYDPATQKWGETWMMPTKAQVKELLDECTWTYNSYRKGYTVIGPSGKNIFLPAAGYSLDGAIVTTLNAYLTGSTDIDDNSKITYLYTAKGHDSRLITDNVRYYGCVIRPVQLTPSSVTLNKSNLEMIIGDAETLTTTVLPAKSRDKSVTWTSSDETVATVDANGQITAIKQGTTTITATTVEGSKTATCAVTVNLVGNAVDLGLPSKLKWASMNIGATTAEATGEYFAWGEAAAKQDYSESAYKYLFNGTYETIGDADGIISGTSYDVVTLKWRGHWRLPTATEMNELLSQCTWSYDATKKGYTVKGPNNNTIFLPSEGYYNGTTLKTDAGCYQTGTSDASDHSKVSFLNVTSSSKALNIGTVRYEGLMIRAVNDENVTTAVTSVSLNKTETTLNLGLNNTDSLETVITPGYASNKKVSWKSSDETVATVTDGVVTAHAAGTANITVTTEDGQKTAGCTVTVLAEESLSLLDITDKIGSVASVDGFNDNMKLVKTSDGSIYGVYMTISGLYANKTTGYKALNEYKTFKVTGSTVKYLSRFYARSGDMDIMAGPSGTVYVVGGCSSHVLKELSSYSYDSSKEYAVLNLNKYESQYGVYNGRTTQIAFESAKGYKYINTVMSSDSTKIYSFFRAGQTIAWFVYNVATQKWENSVHTVNLSASDFDKSYVFSTTSGISFVYSHSGGISEVSVKDSPTEKTLYSGSLKLQDANLNKSGEYEFLYNANGKTYLTRGSKKTEISGMTSSDYGKLTSDGSSEYVLAMAKGDTAGIRVISAETNKVVKTVEFSSKKISAMTMIVPALRNGSTMGSTVSVMFPEPRDAGYHWFYSEIGLSAGSGSRSFNSVKSINSVEAVAETTDSVVEKKSIPLVVNSITAGSDSLISAGLNLSNSGARSFGNGAHSGHQTRVVHTSHGDYMAYLSEELTSQSGVTLNEFSLLKVYNGVTTLLYQDYISYCTSSISIFQGKDGEVYAATATDDKFNETEWPDAWANLAIWHINKADDHVTGYTASMYFTKVNSNGYGYAQPVVDTTYNKIYALFSGGDEPGVLAWYIYDIANMSWEPTEYAFEIPTRYCYHYVYPDGKGGMYFITENDQKVTSAGYPEISTAPIQSANYVFDKLKMYYIPNVHDASKFYTYMVQDADYSRVKDLNGDGKYDSGDERLVNQYPDVLNNHQGDVFLDAQGLLHVLYTIQYVRAAYDRKVMEEQQWHEVFKITSASSVRAIVKERLYFDGYDTTSGVSNQYDFRMAQDTTGQLYILALRIPQSSTTNAADGKFQLYKLTSKTGGYNYTLIHESEKISDTNINVGMCITGTRNNSLKDNTISIMVPTYDQEYGPINWQYFQMKLPVVK